MVKPVIYITRKIPEPVLSPYRSHFEIRMWEQEEIPVPRDVLIKEAEEVDGILCLLTERIDRKLLNNAKRLKIVSNMAVGYDNIDIEAAKEKNIVVTNTPDVLTETTADLAFGLMMAAARRIVEASDYIRHDKWDNWSPYVLAGSDIYGKTIGIVGMGRIGEAVARRAKGFGMTVMYHNRSRKIEAEEELGAKYKTFGSLLTEADFVVCLTPLTEETRNIFNREAFHKMKETAVFVNVSRGGTVEEEALYEAIVEGDIAAAGLDVFQDEPINSEHPLVKLKNVVCLPHIGSASTETRTKMLELSLDNLKAVLDGKPPITPV